MLVLPRPRSSKLTTRAPALLTLDVAEWNFGASAEAGAANARMAVTAANAIMTVRRNNNALRSVLIAGMPPFAPVLRIMHGVLLRWATRKIHSHAYWSHRDGAPTPVHSPGTRNKAESGGARERFAAVSHDSPIEGLVPSGDVVPIRHPPRLLRLVVSPAGLRTPHTRPEQQRLESPGEPEMMTKQCAAMSGVVRASSHSEDREQLISTIVRGR